MIYAQHDSFTIALVEHYYEEAGLDRRWDTQRVLRLCLMLRCSPYELGCLCRIPVDRMKRLLKKNKYLPEQELHFALLESHYIKMVLEGTPLVVMPLNLMPLARVVTPVDSFIKENKAA